MDCTKKQDLSITDLNNLSEIRKNVEIDTVAKAIVDYVRFVAMKPEKYTLCVFYYEITGFGYNRFGNKLYGSYSYIPTLEEIEKRLREHYFTDPNIKIAHQNEDDPYPARFWIDWTYEGQEKKVYNDPEHNKYRYYHG